MMKRIIVMMLLIISGAALAQAQSGNLNGSVKNAAGTPIHFVFVKDQYNDATFTDSTGNFKLSVHDDSRVMFASAGYKDTAVLVIKGADMQVTLLSKGSLTTQGKLSTDQGDQTSTENSTFGTGGYLAPGHQTGTTRGSEYLFPAFVNGFLINSSNILVHDPGYLFDYDKISGDLLLTTDNKTMTIMSKDQTKEVTVFSNNDQSVTFEMVPAIDNTHWVEVLASGKKYAIYKNISTSLVKADFKNNGMTQTGNDYDEYVDVDTYYLLIAQTTKLQKIDLRKKSLKLAFAADGDKLAKFMANNSGDIDDAYLKSLGDYLNNN